MKAVAQKKPTENHKRQRNIVSHHSANQPVFSSSFSNNNILIQRKPICPCGGGCPRCHKSLLIQTKLKIGQPNDKYEQEADRVADQVLRMPEPSVQMKHGWPLANGSSCGSQEEETLQTKRLLDHITPFVQRQAAPEEEEELQAKHAFSFPNGKKQGDLSTHVESLKDRGRPLHDNSRTFFESRMDYDLGHVRIHTDSKAADAAQAIQARAFTFNHDIVFGTNQFQSDSDVGKRLLAHELTHTIQQSAARDTVFRVPQQLPTRLGAASSPSTRTTVVSTSSGPMSRSEFERRMRIKFGVTQFRTGTHTEQNTRVGATIPASQWQSWDPGSSSEVYRFILDAFDDFAWTFAGVPNVNEIVFYHMYYENQNGTAVDNSDVGASYGGGQLTIYSNASSSARLGLPFARSRASGSYPGAPILTVAGTGSTPGAPVGYPTQQQAVKRVIWHELGHGLAESASVQCGTSAAPDPSMLSDYQRAVGWRGGHLYDIGNPTVTAALAAGNAPAAGTEITQNDWNNPRWSEQPISAYMVSGPGEDFAEAVRTFVENPNLLLSRSPARHLFVSTRASALARCFHQVQRPGDYPIPVDDGTRIA